MPFLNVLISQQSTDTCIAKIPETLIKLTADVLGKKRELTAVSIIAIPASNWYVSGDSLDKMRLSSFFLEVKVTEGTNTKSEKSKYIERVFEEMVHILGPLATASYIIINEVRADSWGYGGRSQEFRYITNQAL